MTTKALFSIGSLCLTAGIVVGAGCWQYSEAYCGNQDGDMTCKLRGTGDFCNVCVAANDGCTNEVPPEDCLFVSDVEPTAPCNGRCGEDAPVCDAASDICVACSEHAQCGDAACNFFTGACLSARVVHVGAGQSYRRLESAVSSFTTETSLAGTIIVHAQQSSYKDTIVIDGERTIAFLRFGNDSPFWDNDEADTSPLIVSGMRATALLDGVILTGGWNQAPGLRVTNAGRAWVDRAQIIENSGGGIVVEKGAEVVLRNSFIEGSLEDSNALEIVEGKATVLYSTLGGGNQNVAALACANSAFVVVRNSIIVAKGEPGMDGSRGGVDIDCGGDMVDIAYTATESIVPGIGNVSVGQMPYGNPDAWFVDYANEDFHLQNDGLEVFANIAQWQPGDPLTDIDGDPRPAGTPDHAGADRP